MRRCCAKAAGRIVDDHCIGRLVDDFTTLAGC
jgi:hypothetical protein